MEKGTETETGLKEAPKASVENDMSHLSCDCLQRCQGKSLRISNEITRNDCSQRFPNEIDARPRSQEAAAEHWKGLWP